MPIIDEIYNKVALSLDPGKKSKDYTLSYPIENIQIIDGFGSHLKTSIYYPKALKWSSRLLNTLDSKKPESQISWTQDGLELCVSSVDFEGLLSIISGRCYKSDLDIRQLHAYTSNDGLVFDIFNLGSPPSDFSNDRFTRTLNDDLENRHCITDDPKHILDGLDYSWDLDWDDSGLLKLDFQSNSLKKGLLYSLTRGLYQTLGANIYAAKSQRDLDHEQFGLFFNSKFPDFDSNRQRLENFFSK